MITTKPRGKGNYSYRMVIMGSTHIARRTAGMIIVGSAAVRTSKTPSASCRDEQDWRDLASQRPKRVGDDAYNFVTFTHMSYECDVPPTWILIFEKTAGKRLIDDSGAQLGIRRQRTVLRCEHSPAHVDCQQE